MAIIIDLISLFITFGILFVSDLTLMRHPYTFIVASVGIIKFIRDKEVYNNMLIMYSGAFTFIIILTILRYKPKYLFPMLWSQSFETLYIFFPATAHSRVFQHVTSKVSQSITCT